MFEVLAHSDLPHELVLVAVHARKLAHMGKDVLQPISKLRRDAGDTCTKVEVKGQLTW